MHFQFCFAPSAFLRSTFHFILLKLIIIRFPHHFNPPFLHHPMFLGEEQMGTIFLFFSLSKESRLPGHNLLRPWPRPIHHLALPGWNHFLLLFLAFWSRFLESFTQSRLLFLLFPRLVQQIPLVHLSVHQLDHHLFVSPH